MNSSIVYTSIILIIAVCFVIVGLWEFMLADLRWDHQPCAKLSGCTAFGIKTKKISFDMFYNA